MPTVTPYDKAPRVPPEEVPHAAEKVVMIRRIAKVTAGGKHMRFNALVVLGDSQGHVGLGLGKANAVPDAIRKGVAIARRNLIRVPLRGPTIPHVVQSKYRASSVLLRPAVAGSGVLAGATVRAVMDLAGVKDVLTKSLGNSNPINLARATVDALASMEDPDEPPRRRPLAAAAAPRAPRQE